MRLGVSRALHKNPAIERAEIIAGFRTVERFGFAGLWFFDTVGRGNFFVDPLMQASVAASVTENIEVGTCILQVPIRRPVELAHRILSA